MNYRFEYETTINEYKNINSFIPILLLRWINMNHYVLLFSFNYLEYLLFHNNYINKIFIFNTNIGINNSKNLIAKDRNIC